MDRRRLFKEAAFLGIAAGIVPLAASSKNLQASSSEVAEKNKPTSDKSPQLTVPPEGKLPVAFVLGKDAEVLDFCGPLEVFAGASTKDGKELFSPYIVSATKDPVKVGGGMRVMPDHTFKTAPSPKVIVIPAMDMDGLPEEMFDWIRKASKTADITMSVCNGAFVLAKTGLLSGKRCTSHHGGYFRFAGTYPDVKLIRGARYVEDGKFATAGGVSSGIDLALRVVERYVGTEIAEELADGIEYQGKGWRNPDSNNAYARLPEFNEKQPRCPLCLMEGDRSIFTSHKGMKLYFCSKGEKDFFDKHTEVFDRFLAEDAKQSGKHK